MHPPRPVQNVITPTTKAEDHDEPISPADIVRQGLMSQVGLGGWWGGWWQRPRCMLTAGRQLAAGQRRPAGAPAAACTARPCLFGISQVLPPPPPPPPVVQEDWDAVSTAALQLFAFGQQQAAQRGLLLVDTKYEFGKDEACAHRVAGWVGLAGGVEAVECLRLSEVH